MTDDLSNKALAEVEPFILLYLSELGNLMQVPPEFQDDFKFTAHSRLKTLQKALKMARQKYEVALPDGQVIKYGIGKLGSHTRLLTCYDNSIEGQQLAATLHRTLEIIISEGPGVQGTLPGLLDFAGQYALQP